MVFDILVGNVVPVVEDTIFEDKSFEEILGICLLETSLMPVVEDISLEETIPVGAIFLYSGCIFWVLKSIMFLVCFFIRFAVDLGAFRDPKWVTSGAWGGPGSEKVILQNKCFI